MAFEVLDQNITQLFKNDDTFFIPRYQRNYVWKELNWRQLIKDIRYCAEVTPDWSHFIGSMVFERKQSSGGMVAIIDGQQRILTLQIVIFSLIFCFKNIKDSTTDVNIQKQCDSNITYLQDLIRNRTLGNDDSIKVENGYEEFVELNQALMKIEGSNLEKYYVLIADQRSSSSIILKAFKFFVIDFQKLDFQELATLTKQFLETRVVTISSMQEEEVYNIFEILNARGVKLKQVELLKNYLFKYLKPKSLLDTYKIKWANLEQRLEKVDLDDYYLHMFRCWFYKNRLKKDQLFEITKEKLKENDQKDLPDFFNFFIQGTDYYYGIDSVEGDEVEKEVYEYFKLKRNKQVRSVLLALKIKYEKKVLDIDSYHQLLIMLRNFWVTFNLDNGSSNKIDGDVYILSNEIFKSNDKQQIEYAVFKFLKKYSTYYNKENVLENGLKNIVYSNKTNRKNISSKLLVYFLKPLLLEEETNKYAQYDFSKFNVEHVLNDDPNDEVTYSLGNLLLCPEELNGIMKDLSYDKKRSKLHESNIPYLVNFATKYAQFDEKAINERKSEVIDKLKRVYLLSKDLIENNYNHLEMFFELKKQLTDAFGENNSYVLELENKGLNQFITYIYMNGSLPENEVEKIKRLLPKSA